MILKTRKKKMNDQRSETSLNWCSVEWESCRRAVRDTEYRCVNTRITAVGSSTSARETPCRQYLCCCCAVISESPYTYCRRTSNTDSCYGNALSPSPLTPLSVPPSGCTLLSCVNLDRSDADTGMAGRLGEEITSSNAAPPISWLNVKGSGRHLITSSALSSTSTSTSSSVSSSSPLSNRSCLGILLLYFQFWFAVARAWVLPLSPCHFSVRRWTLYLFCYLIFFYASGSTASQVLESNPKSDDSPYGVGTVQDYLEKNFPDIINDSESESPSTNRIRQGRAGKLRATNLNMKMIDRESVRANCQPRDTVLDSYEELNIAKGYDTKVFPACIVVRRCKNGGCCRDDQECEARGNGRQNVSKLDIACECVEKPDFCSPPETDCPNGKVWSYGQCGCTCRYRCPKPFLQDESTCACDCLMNNRVCKNIQRGRKDLKLSSEECDCVRGGLCGTPNCVNGRFSLNKCKCAQETDNWS